MIDEFGLKIPEIPNDKQPLTWAFYDFSRSFMKSLKRVIEVEKIWIVSGWIKLGVRKNSDYYESGTPAEYIYEP